MDDHTAGLVLDHVEIRQAGQVLVQLNHRVKPGEVLTLMGPSGIGKSTLLSAITGALAPVFELSGRILLNGRDITELPPHQRHTGILFQDPLLFPHMSVGANLAFGLAPGGSRQNRQARVEEVLAEVGLEGYASRDPDTLSGGQRARVALMRMLLSDPQALLLDEPFSGLDASLRTKVRNLVFERAKACDLPVLMVTHDAEDAKAAGGEVITLGV
ncbi:ATP-binding cassette domain-containing protein [Aliiroseovarius sp. KMU-50]|uniref:ATP-binding cassette domain-containing protein n=1 Tax=Aliiroseovarius salicola TaxID=3009082 RepID=A0ABT4W4E1_9RHOB|nr:ATP-binding cassette domain-containing protein [Aliiroseovarius sp. KMU-50]MDA5095346.1 ATP-binding cassette domain-containing protein [Aliiroseovarius sp. KMU-50]